MNTEERQLAEMLHRVTPEPPRRVTVEDVASRLVSQAGQAPRRRDGYREPRPRLGWNRGWAPVLAAVSVFAVAGTSAGIAVALSSHHNHVTSPGGGGPASSAPVSSAPVSSSPSSVAPSQPPASAGAHLRIAGGLWGAELINRQSFGQDSLVGSAGSLYATTGDSLDRIDPATGNILRTAPFRPLGPDRPVVLGNTVWVVSAYSGGNIVLRGYDAKTLAQVRSVPVPAIGPVSSTAQGVLAGGPDGQLYLAAGETVAVVDPATGQLAKRINLFTGPASTVAVAPDGSRLYVGMTPSTPSTPSNPSTPSTPAGTFQLRTYDLATGRQVGSSRLATAGAGNLVATSGGVWGTDGSGNSEWVWFAPGGDLSKSFRVGAGAGGGLDAFPALSGGAVWVGGTRQLVCASPETGKVLASAAIPADHGGPEYFDSVTVLSSGRAYALYQDGAAQLSGVAALTPPAGC